MKVVSEKGAELESMEPPGAALRPSHRPAAPVPYLSLLGFQAQPRLHVIAPPSVELSQVNLLQLCLECTCYVPLRAPEYIPSCFIYAAQPNAGTAKIWGQDINTDIHPKSLPSALGPRCS